jgi:hypothetical protein
MSSLKTSYEEEIHRRRRSPHPLSSIFDEDTGSLVTPQKLKQKPVFYRNRKYRRMARGWNEHAREHSWFIHPLEEGAFFLNFRQYPIDFLRAEHSREAKCKELGIEYVPPQLTDSVQVTLERISMIEGAIKSAEAIRDKANKSAADKLRRKTMTEEERKVVSAKRAEYRRKKKLNESEEDAIKRRARQAQDRKRQRDRKFDKYCEYKKVPCPSPREAGDTASTTRAKRKMCTDAAKRREEEEVWERQERIRKEKEDAAARNRDFVERARRSGWVILGDTEDDPRGRKIGLPRNTEGPGVETDSAGNKYAYGREAAAAMHSIIKNDIKNGKSTVYEYGSTLFGNVDVRWQPEVKRPELKRCKQFVRKRLGKTVRYSSKGETKVGRCPNSTGGDLCRECRQKKREAAEEMAKWENRKRLWCLL